MFNWNCIWHFTLKSRLDKTYGIRNEERQVNKHHMCRFPFMLLTNWMGEYECVEMETCHYGIIIVIANDNRWWIFCPRYCSLSLWSRCWKYIDFSELIHLDRYPFKGMSFNFPTVSVYVWIFNHFYGGRHAKWKQIEMSLILMIKRSRSLYLFSTQIYKHHAPTHARWISWMFCVYVIILRENVIVVGVFSCVFVVGINKFQIERKNYSNTSILMSLLPCACVSLCLSDRGYTFYQRTW